MTSPPLRPRHPGAGLSRRSLLAGAGLSAAAISGLTGCGRGTTPSSAQSSTVPVTASTADIPVGGGTIFPQAATVITQPTAGQFKAFSSICTHAGCPVTAVTDTIACTCHGSRFAIADGSVVSGPATRALPARTVQVADGTVTASG